MHSQNVIRVTFLAAGIVSMLFGLFFLLAARQAIESYNLGTPTVPALLFARSTGAALVSLGVVNLLAAFDPGSRALFALVIANIVIHVLSIGVDFSQPYGKTAGTWVALVVHIVFLAAFGYCLVHWNRVTRRPAKQS